MGKMSIVFYKEVGFSKSDIAIYSKGLGWITTVIFTLIGGLFALRTGVVRALLISGVAMAATNILFSVLHWVGQNELMFAIAVIADDLAAAFATVAFVTFISLLVDPIHGDAICASCVNRHIGPDAACLFVRRDGRLAEW